MKRKKCIVLILILIVLLSSCTSEKTETDRAKEKVETTLASIKAADSDKLKNETGFDMEVLTEGSDENKHMMKLLVSDIFWSFVSGEFSEGKGDLVYKIKTKEIEELIMKTLAGAFEGKFDLEDDKAAMKYMEEVVKDLSEKEKEITFNLTQEGEEFKIGNIEDVLETLIGLDSEFFNDDELTDDGYEARSGTEFKLDETIQLDGNDFTAKSFEIVDTWEEGKKAIKMTYEWKNNSDQTKKATDCFTFRGFQNGEDVDTFIFSDSIDTSFGSVEVEPGKSQDNCQTGFLLVEESPMVIRVSEFDSFDSPFFEIHVDPSTLK